MVVIHRQWRLHECFPIAPRTTADPGGINIGFRGRADRAPKLLERAELVVPFRGNAILRPQIRPACLGGQLDGSPRTLITSLAESVTGRRPSESLARFLCATAILGVAHQVAYQVIGHEPRVCQGTLTTRLLDIVCIIGVLTGPVGRGFENICGSVCNFAPRAHDPVRQPARFARISLSPQNHPPRRFARAELRPISSLRPFMTVRDECRRLGLDLRVVRRRPTGR